jgi:signal transduction histidine kinase/ActR/RegA family two-component response regulator
VSPVLSVVLCCAFLAADGDRPLETARAVRELPREHAAAARPVVLTGTVTRANRHFGDLFVQDDTGGIYINPTPLVAGLTEGDRVTVRGVTDPGTFAPSVRASAVTKVGSGRLPEPELHNLDPDDNRWLDARYVEIRAYVQTVATVSKHIRLGVATAKGAAAVYLPDVPGEHAKAAELVGSVVRIRGVCGAPQHDPKTGVAGRSGRVHIASLRAVEVIPGGEPVPGVVSVARVRQGFVPGPAPFARPFAVRGVVTLAMELEDGPFLVVQDETGAARVRTVPPTPGQAQVQVGDAVEVVGFAHEFDPSVLLVNATVQKAPPLPPPLPALVTADQLTRGNRWGMLTEVMGEVRSVTAGQGEVQVECVDGAIRFTVLLVTSETPPDLLGLEPGTRVAVTGVPTVTAPRAGEAAGGFRLTARTPDDVRVVAPPARLVSLNWWTAERVRNLILAVGATGVLAAAWLVLLRRQVRRQTAVIRGQYERQARLEESLQETRRLEALGRLVGGIAHDFNNLLTVIIGGCDMANRSLAAGQPAATWLDAVRLAAGRAADLTAQLLTFARENPARPTSADLNAVLRGAEALVRPTVGDRVRVVTEYAPGLPAVPVDAGRLTQMILNLAANARDAMPDGGTLTVRTAATEVDGRPGARLTVADTGVGMDAATQAHIFDPFFTTKPVGKGTGLGLATVYGIVRGQGGRVWVRSAPGAGATFIIELPAAGGVAPSDTRAAGTGSAAPPVATILLVDDDATVRETCAAALRQFGHRVEVAETPAAALALARSDPGRFDLLVTDVLMPDLTGPQLAAQVRASCPDVPVLFISGYPDDALSAAAELPPGDRFLSKPFTPSKLGAAVEEILAARRGQPRHPPLS